MSRLSKMTAAAFAFASTLSALANPSLNLSVGLGNSSTRFSEEASSTNTSIGVSFPFIFTDSGFEFFHAGDDDTAHVLFTPGISLRRSKWDDKEDYVVTSSSGAKRDVAFTKAFSMSFLSPSVGVTLYAPSRGGIFQAAVFKDIMGLDCNLDWSAPGVDTSKEKGASECKENGVSLSWGIPFNANWSGQLGYSHGWRYARVDKYVTEWTFNDISAGVGYQF